MLVRDSQRMVYCILLSFIALATQHAHCQEETARTVPNGFIVTASGTLQAAQGELVLFVGDRADVAPLIFQPSQNSGIQFSMPFGDHSYQFHAAEQVIESTSASFRVCVINVTATAKPKAESDAVIWCAWRHQSKTSGKGMMLASESSSQDAVNVPLPWQDNWTWFFNNGSYRRDNYVVYFSGKNDGWSRSNWVRPPQKPYTPLLPQSLTGFTRFSKKLLPNQSAAIRIFVPFLPTEPEILKILNISE